MILLGLSSHPSTTCLRAGGSEMMNDGGYYNRRRTLRANKKNRLSGLLNRISLGCHFCIALFCFRLNLSHATFIRLHFRFSLNAFYKWKPVFGDKLLELCIGNYFGALKVLTLRGRENPSLYQFQAICPLNRFPVVEALSHFFCGWYRELLRRGAP